VYAARTKVDSDHPGGGRIRSSSQPPTV